MKKPASVGSLYQPSSEGTKRRGAMEWQLRPLWIWGWCCLIGAVVLSLKWGALWGEGPDLEAGGHLLYILFLRETGVYKYGEN